MDSARAESAGGAGCAADIEEQLRESERRLALAQRAGHVGVFDWDLTTNRIFATAETEAIYGLAQGRAHYTFDDFLRLLHEADRERIVAEIQATLRAGLRDMAAEFRIVRPDGKERRLSQKAIITYDPGGEPRRMVGTSLDVTEFMQAQEVLRASEEKFSRIFQLCPDAIALNRANDGVYVDLNAGFERITGWSRAEILGRSSLPHDLGIWVRHADREGLVQHLRLHGQTMDCEAEFRRKDGSTIMGLMSARLIEVNGETCILSITRDITQSKRDKAQLIQQHAVLHALINSTEDPVFSVDRNYCYTLFNGSHARMIKQLFGVEVAVGMSAVDYMPPEAREIIQANLDRAREGQHVEFELPGPNAKGETRAYYVILSPVRGQNGAVTGVAVFGHDFTDQRRLQAQLLQAQKMEAIGLLAGGIAHDFRNQLTVIMAAGELIRDDAGLSRRGAQFLEQIMEAARQSSDMISKLLSFSRKQMVQNRRVDVADLAEESARILPRLLRADIRLEFAAESRPLMAFLDPVEFQQAMLNLATNARDAMPDGGRLRITCRRVVPDAAFCVQHADAAERYVGVEVSDTGHGMDAATVARIFEPFFTTKPLGQGTGLGLSMVYGFVKQCGGIVDVNSTPGAGTTFTLLFRELAGEPATESGRLQSGSLKPGEGAERARRKRVLIVEDDQAIRHLLCCFLSEAGYEAIESPGATKALALLEDKAVPWDLLVSDVVMPGWSGVDLARKVRALRPRLPTLLISGYGTTHDARNTAEDMGWHFLAKPFSRESLLRVVAEALKAGVAPSNGNGR